MFVESRPFDYISFKGVVNLRDQLEGQSLRLSISFTARQVEGGYLEYGRWWYAMTQKIIQLGADNQNLRRCMFCHDVVCYLRDKGFPVWWWYGCLIRDLLTGSPC